MGIISGDCTKFLHPLNVSVSKPFKAFFLQYYDEWYWADNFKYIKVKLIKPPMRKLEVKWVIKSWKKIDKNINKSFYTWWITSSNSDKIHSLIARQPVEEALVLLNEKKESLEYVPQAARHNSYDGTNDDIATSK